MKFNRTAAAAAVTLTLILAGCTSSPDEKDVVTPPSNLEAIEQYEVTVVKTLAHDTNAFTQGLELIGPDLMVESTGGYGTSSIRIIQLSTGKTVKSTDLPENQFGEGATVVDDKIVQLTWKDNVAHVWKLDDLTKTAEPFKYNNEGWGLCYDKTRGVLWRSDGTEKLTAHDPKTFEPKQTSNVFYQTRKVQRINELECVDGYVWANVWQSDIIMKINPETGQVIGSANLSQLTQDAATKAGKPFDQNQVLNGIAYDSASKTFYVTGKQWPTMYQLKIETKEAPK